MIGKLDAISKDVDYRGLRLAEYDIILSRMQLLTPADRILLELHLQHNVNFTQLAILVGIEPQNISRRIQKMVKRLLDEDYMNILRNKTYFSDEQLEIAYDHYLLGQGRNTIAVKRKIAPSRVYRELRFLRDWLGRK